MDAPIAEGLSQWHNFYAVIGGASATLIGAMFVVASIGSGFLTPQSAPQIRTFLTPTVLHLSSVLVGCGVALAPFADRRPLVVLFGAGGLAGVAYSAVVALWVWRHAELHIDRVWYAALPLLGYVSVAAAAVLIPLRNTGGLEALATGLLLLLIAGIRNAWDLILFLVTQPRNGK
jgi:hypothetical protein